MGDEWVLVVVVLLIILVANNNNIRKSIEFSSPTGFVKIQCPTGVINASNFTGEFPLCFMLNNKIYDAQSLGGLGCIDTVYYVNATGYKLILLNSTEALNTLEQANVNKGVICPYISK
jgi:hypothetical protein